MSLKHEPSSEPLHISAKLLFGRLRASTREREFFLDNPLVRIYFISEMIWWTGLAPWEFEFPFPGSIISTFLASLRWPALATPDSSQGFTCYRTLVGF